MKYALLVFFAAGTLAAPFWVLDENLPRTEVKEVGCQGNRFRGGASFTYDYAGETINNIEGSSKHSTGLQLRARVYISPLEECTFTMQVGKTELLSKSKNQESFTRTAESQKFKNELQKHVLLFTMSGNKISKLEAPSAELKHVLNIKRGILSTLQLNEDGTTETDVNGICETEIKKQTGTIIKTKNLSECSKRAINEIGIQTASIKTESSMRPLDSQSKCTYVMDGDTIKSVVCDETHLFKPFSAGYKTPSGAMTVVKQQMTLVKKEHTLEGNSGISGGIETSLVFDHSSEEMTSTNTINGHVDEIMARLVNKGKLSATQNSAHDFSSLVFVLRKMDEKRMKPIWDKYFDCIESRTCSSSDYDLRDVYRQYLLDAVAYCGTSTCISMVRNVIIAGEVNGERMNMFLQSIALVGKTTKKMIQNVLEIVKKQPSRQAHLTLGTLLARHCGKLPEECVFDKTSPISKAESYLESKLGNDCSGQRNHERVEEIIMVLKAIGNAKRPIRARSSLIRCAKNAIHANITRAAFDAFRGMPCDGQQTDDILNVVTDSTVDTEIRIHAFIALMHCPSEDVLDHVLHALDAEQSRQVASFMWSHLTNIMESSDSKHSEAKALLEKLTKITPLRKMDLPYHKFSRSYEKSLRLDGIKSGASVAGHVIFRPDGYFPKSGLLNLTAEVLGTSVQVLETSIAIDGLESILADAFGPNGVMPDNFVFKMFNYTWTAEKLREMAQKEEEARTRQPRNTKDRLSQIHDKVNMKSVPPTGHFSIKVMGQEIRVMSYDDIFWMIDQIDNMNVVQLLMNVAKGGHKTFSKSMLFLEMTHTVPTSLGLPLKLKLVGSTVATVELDGKFDIRNMFWGPGALMVNGYVKPSAVVELSGQMGIESHFVSSGIFVNSSMFVSNMMKGSINFKEGQLLKINVDTPEEPVQLFNISTTPFMYINEQADMIEGTPRKINPDFCFKSKIIGYGLCTKMRLPVAYREYEAPYFPLSGPAHFGVNLVRGDEKLTTFQFKVAMTKRGPQTTGTIEFSTPGATYERKLNGQLVYKDVDNTKSLVLSTERYGKRGEVEFNYNTVTHATALETRNNFFTPKDIITRWNFFNKTNMISKQFGMLVAAEYDWYKFEHETKYIQKDFRHTVQSSTTYYPKKSVTSALEYDAEERKLSARLQSDQFNQAAEVNGQWVVKNNEKGLKLTATHLSSGKTASIYGGYINKGNEKEIVLTAKVLGKTMSNILGYYKKDGLKSVQNFLRFGDKTARLTATYDDLKSDKVLAFEADILGRKANTDFILVNTDAEKSVRMIVNVAQKTGESKFGFYSTPSMKTLRLNVDVLGKQGEVFVDVNTAEGYRTTVGAVAGKYVAGLRGVYTNNHGHGKSICTAIYYGTESTERVPLELCSMYHSLGKAYVHKRLTFSVELKETNKKAALEFDVEKHTGHITLVSKAIYNSKVYGKNTYDLKFNDYKNAALKMDVEVGKYIAGWKVFTQTLSSKTNVGMEAYVMDKTITFINTYVSNIYSGGKKMQIKSQLLVNGKALPVSTEVAYVSGNGLYGPSFILNVGSYAVGYFTVVNYNKVEYGYGSEFVLTKGEKSLFKVYHKTQLTLKEQKDLSQKYGVVAFGKTYEYGWEATYANRGTTSKSAHALTLRLQYSTTRKASVTFTLANGKKTAELIVDVEYIPKKQVSHIIRYTKEARQLDVTIEFLPKMYAKFMARLDKIKGYSFTTNMMLQWSGYKRSLKVVNAYTNTRKEITLSTKVGNEINFGVVLTKSPKSMKLFADVFKYSGNVKAFLSRQGIKIRVMGNNKVLLNVLADYNSATNAVKFSVSNARKTWFKIGGNYNKVYKQVKMYVTGFGRQDWIRINVRYQRNMVTFNAFALDKPMLQVVATQTKNDVSLQLNSPQFKRGVIFKGAVDRSTKSIEISAKSSETVVGVTMRGDWKNYVLGFTGFVNKMESGWKMYMEKHALVYQMIFTPSTSAKVIFEVQDDKILKITVQRTVGNNEMNETAFQYKLTNGMSQFMFKWNPETVNKMLKSVQDLIVPLSKTVSWEVKRFWRRFSDASQKFISESSRDAAKATLNFLDRCDKIFDEIDFVGIKDKFGEVCLTSLRGLTKVIRLALVESAKALDNFRENLPEWIHKSKSFVSRTRRSLEVSKFELEKNIKVISKLILKVAKNLTESTRPVINKAIELIRDFKLRGKTMNELVALAKVNGQRYVNIYIKMSKEMLADLKIKGTKVYNDAKVYILKLKVPYREETVKDVIAITLNKATELKDKLNNVDIKDMVQKVQKQIMNYDIQGKTIDQRLVVLQKDLKNLPETTRKAVLEIIRLVRVVKVFVKKLLKVNKVNAAYIKVVKFAEPATNHVKFVAKTIDKHFGPLTSKAIQKITNQIKMIKLPSVAPYITKQWEKIEKFFLPLIKPIVPLYNNVMAQVRMVRFMNFHVGAVFDMQMQILSDTVNSYMKKSQKMLTKQMKAIDNYVEKVTAMTAEELVNAAFDNSMKMGKDAMEYTQTMMKDREVMIKKTINKIKETYKVMTKQYNTIKSRSAEEVMETLIHESSEKLMTYAGELSSLLKQLADMDISGPTWNAWKQANLLGHLDSYGVNGKIMFAIQAAKDVKLSKVVLNGIKLVRKFVDELYGDAFIKAIQGYNKLEKMVDYIKSIPKKEYEQWFHELKDFAKHNQKDIVKFVIETYKTTKERAVDYYNKARETSKVNYNILTKTAYDYVEPAKEAYNTIADKSRLVYNEVKQPTIDVTNHYKDIGTKFVTENYQLAYNKLRKEYENMYKDLKLRLDKLSELVDKTYEQFLEKYGDMTWEEVGDEIYKYSEEKAITAKDLAVKQYKKMNAIVLKLKEQAEKLYQKYRLKCTMFCMKYRQIAEEKYAEIKPKVINMYNEYKMKSIETYKKSIQKLRNVYADVKGRATDIYNNNKDKTLKRLYIEIKAILIQQFNQQYKLASAFVNRNVENLAATSKKYYTKADVLMRTIILPELKKECESIINQTLRSSVAMSEEIAKAYYPHFNLARNAMSEASEMMRNEAVVAFSESKVFLNDNVNRLIKVLKEFLSNLKNKEMYKRLINHEYVLKATEKVKQMMKITKAKIEELKSHPTTLKYKKQAEQKIAEYKRQLTVYKKQLEQLYQKYSKHPKVIKANQLLKQMRKSLLYTYNKLSEKVIPQLKALEAELNRNLEKVPVSCKNGFVFFRKHPEEAFWLSVGMAKSSLNEMYKISKDFNYDLFQDKAQLYLDLAKDMGAIMIDECIDNWTKTTTQKLYYDAVATVKDTRKRIVKVPGELKRMAMKLYKDNIRVMKQWIQHQYSLTAKSWSRCPFRAVVTNPIWSEIVDEVSEHEIVDLTNTVVAMSKDKVLELTSLAVKEYKKQVAVAQKRLVELKKQATEKYDVLKEQSIQKYQDLVAKLNNMVAAAERFVEETTVADIVEATQQKYKDLVKLVKETKANLIALKEKYTGLAKRLYAKYLEQAKQKYQELYAKAEALVMKYKQKAMPYYLKYKNQAEKVYQKYYPVVKAKYEKLYKEAERLYKKSQIKYEEVRMQVLKKIEELKSIVEEYKLKSLNYLKKLPKDAYKKWMESELRSKLITFKKMSIKETIEALKTLPAQTREFAIKQYNIYYRLAKKMYEKEYERFLALAGKYNKVYIAKRDELLLKARPYTDPAIAAYKWVQNEIKEAAIFVYRYHRLRERYTMAKDYVTSEYKRIAPLIPVTLNKYAKQYKTKAIRYADEFSVIAKDYANEMLSKAGHGTLRGIHSTLRYIDNIDLKAIQAKSRIYLDFIAKYVSIDSKKGEFIISIPLDITPSFNYHISKTQRRVRRSIDTIQEQSNKMVIRLKTELNVLKLKLNQMKNQLQQQILDNTIELRSDLKASYGVNKKVFEQLYKDAKILSQKTYKTGTALYKIYKPKAIKMLAQAKAMSKTQYRKFLKASKDAYLKASAMLLDMYRAGPTQTYKKMITFATQYSKMIRGQAIDFYKTYKPIAYKKTNEYINFMTLKAKQAKKEIDPYYKAVKSAVLKVKGGMSVRQAFSPIYRELVFASKYYQQKLKNQLSQMKVKVCQYDTKLCKHIKESLRLHSDLYNKYSARVADAVVVGKAHMYRYIRLAKYKMQSSCSRDYNDVAMIFGNKHILTFDNKFYDIPKIKLGCSYLLAHDFANGKFSVMLEKDAIIIKSTDMTIKINSNGKVKTEIAGKTTTGLPVESGSSKCLRKAHTVKCHFGEQKIRVVVNLKHFFTRISVSGWHFGKTQGLLGTNNREEYDDWKLPNGQIAKNIVKFFNAFELSGKGKCKMSYIAKSTCQKLPSKKCYELFKSKSSPLAGYFSSVDSEAFFRACELDTSDCEKKSSPCSTVSAYVSMLRSRGYWVSHLPECLSHESHSVYEEWTQAPLKRAVDVVVMMSQRRNAFTSRKQVAKLMMHLQRSFKRSKYNTRYALIGFGGNGIHESAHTHPLGTGYDVFGNIAELTREITVMPYGGKGDGSNDAYHAILNAARIRFRPGASKVFVLFNTEPHSSYEFGPAYDEALYSLKKEADATFFVFDKFTFKHLSSAGQMIGQTTRKMYTAQHLNGLTESSLQIPSSEFTSMVQSKNGGWFSSRIRNPKQVSTSLFNAIQYQLRLDSNLCQTCRVEPTYTDVPRVLCRTNAEAKC